jgi:hypothetical protein
MGIRIEAYAVDLPRLDTFLNTSLADLLVQYHRDGIDEDRELIFTIGDTPDTFSVIPRGRIRACVGALPNRTDESLTEDQVRTTEALQRSAREHISRDNIYQAQWLFEGFSNCRGIDFIKQLIDGQRTLWVGRLLQSANILLEADEYNELARLFRQILRGNNCSIDATVEDPGFVTDGLPFKPDNDPDTRFGRWSETDCSTAMLLLQKIMASSPIFDCWVRDNVASLLQMRDLNYRVRNMLSFIG